MKNLFILLCFIGLVSVNAQTVNIDSVITAQMQLRHVPGLSALILKKGEPVWYKAYGKAYIELDVNATPNTAFMLASVSKTITATALMQVWENGGFNLDDNINDYLPFTVDNPYVTNDTITFRNLLTHTSGIADNWDVLSDLYVEGDSPILLDDFLHGYFDTTGAYYDANANFSNNAPGTNYDYSNVGATLCGYLVQTITGIDFNQYCKDSIFTPLCMDNTAWFISELDFNNVALPYYYDTGLQDGIPHYGYPDYPDGQLRTNTTSLGRFLNMYMNYGVHNGVRILDSTTVALMLSHQIPTVEPAQGLIWYSGTLLGKTVWGHNGGDIGVSTEMYLIPQDSVGIIVLCNGNEVDLGTILVNMVNYANSLNATNAGYPCGILLSDYAEPITDMVKLNIYPNPSVDVINVEVAKSFAGLPIVIYTSTGQIAKEIRGTEEGAIKINISGLSPGIYLAVWNGVSKQFIIE